MKELSPKQFEQLKNINLTDINIKNIVKNLNDFKEKVITSEENYFDVIDLKHLFSSETKQLTGEEVTKLFKEWSDKHLNKLDKNEVYVFSQFYSSEVYVYKTKMDYEDEKSVINKIRKNVIDRKKEEKLKETVLNISFDNKISVLNSLLEDKEIINYLEQNKKGI